ncbi:anti-sigma factor [Kribbella sp. WER1]
MNEPDVHTLAGPYVLDALPEDERNLFESHLAECDFCSAEVEELREAAVRLATPVQTPPPPALKPTVLAAIEQVRQLPPQVPASGPVARARRLTRRSILALAAAALAIATANGVAVVQYRAKNAQLQANQRITAVLTEPDARTVRGSVSGGGQAIVVASGQADAAVVVLRDLPKLPDHRTWQLWMIDRSRTAHSIGLATGNGTQVIDGGVTGRVAFGLTIEPDGGSTAPTLPAAAMISMT